MLVYFGWITGAGILRLDYRGWNTGTGVKTKLEHQDLTFIHKMLLILQILLLFFKDPPAMEICLNYSAAWYSSDKDQLVFDGFLSYPVIVYFPALKVLEEFSKNS